MKNKFILFLIFLISAICFFGLWQWQKNVYSKDILKLEIFGPEEAEILEEVEYLVKYKNNGQVRLEEAKLIFEYPQNSISEEGETRVEKNLEAIYPGEEKTISFKARLLGKEKEVKIAQAWLSYRPKNLKAFYESNTSFSTIIKSVPLTFEFDLPSKIEAGKDFSFRINYFSNLDYLLTKLRVQIDYPSGFEFIDSSPKSLEKVEWDIPILNRSQGGKIEIRGRLLGEVGEPKIFRARLGIWQAENFILLKEIEKGAEIIKPSIYLRQEINGNPQYVSFPGDWLHYQIYFKNIGDSDLTNLFLISKLEGEAFDFQTIKSEIGEFKPGDNSIVFDWRRVPQLQLLSPMEEGKVEFWIKLKDDLGNVKNPILVNKVFLGQAKEEFVTKISSKLEIVQKGYFEDEIFGNSGPLPPKVGQTTTYTISWQIKNYYSDVKGVKVKATLPPQVSLTGKIFPEEEVSKFAFDSETREIVWLVGDLERGVGISKPPRTLSFQVGFLPSEAQRGQTPEIISQVKISGEDSWTGGLTEGIFPALNTSLPDDPTMTPEKGIVQ
jgi:hypothetical protein